MESTRREVGLVDADNCTHVVIPNLSGAAAFCGAGQIVKRIPGWFDPSDPLACGDCVELVTGNRST